MPALQFNDMRSAQVRILKVRGRRPHLPKMQTFRGVAGSLAKTVGRQSCSVSQLPALVSHPLVGQFTLLHEQQRCFASMPLSTEKQRVVVLGTGWAAGRLTKDLNCNHYDITVDY